ncbi:MAG: SEC-C domain-containing protein, partial [Candidatus Omnitrophica bacterium]|nr:SEC-C domain-containing protein [Candidatus Omnitrophota bacterium]
FQNYFRMYGKLAGMTGTAYTEANEFKQIYNLDVVVIPTNRPLIRANNPDCIYKTAREKYNAVVDEIAECHKKGQPVLVGTISIEKSELVSGLLKQKGVPHQVLNAKYHDLEAHIIAQAGRYGAITIATNMAGRGTDIVLGGNAEYLARALASEKKDSIEEKDREAMIKTFIGQFKDQVSKEREQVLTQGGLHVIGTERHESRRIDNQLRGRCGRQGDPGSSRFYVSLQDDLMRLFASDTIMAVMDKMGMQEGEVIESRMVSGALEVAQKRVENYNFEIRKQLLDYDNVMNKQREVIYSMRRSILEGENVKDVILDKVLMASDNMVEEHYALEKAEEVFQHFAADVQSRFGVNIEAFKEQWATLHANELKQELENVLLKVYEEKEAQVTPEMMRRMERMILLHVIDTKWKEHLYNMDQVKDGISLRALGQRDPLVEYKKEGFAMFKTMYSSINHEVGSMIFRLEAAPEAHRPRSVFSTIPQQAVHQEFQSGMPQAGVSAQQTVLEETSVQSRSEAAVTRQGPKVGRNDPCPCGSGKKYKKCCGTGV